MTRKEEIINYANSFKGVGVENEELKETIRLAIIDGAMWADEHPIHYDGKAYLYVLNKGAEQGKKEMLDKACEWLSNVPIEDMQHKYDNFDTSEGWYKFIKDFLKAMEDKL